MVHEIVKELLPIVGGRQQIDGIILTGGCSLNVLANRKVEDSFGLPVFVPPGSNDGGLSVGALWAVQPPRVVAPLQYTGFRLWDIERLDNLAGLRGAKKIDGPVEMARIIAGVNGNGEHPIVAV